MVARFVCFLFPVTNEGAVRAAKTVVAAADAVPAQVRRIEEDQFSALWGGTHNRFVVLVG